MRSDVVTSHEAPHLFAQSSSGDSYVQCPPDDSYVQGMRQPPSAYTQITIDPRTFTLGNVEPFLQANASQIYLRISEGEAYLQHPSPVLSAPTSTPIETRMSYTGDEFPMPMPSPTESIVSHTCVTYAMPVDGCICGHNCRRGSCIPQREYDRPRTDPLTEYELREVIWFSVRGTCGYHLGDALRKAYTGLDGRDNRVFTRAKSSISIRLEWPGYEKWTKQIRTLTWKQPPDNISLAKLATEVAKRMEIFLKEMHSKAVDPAYIQFRVRPGVIDIDHLELVALKRVAKASYMPHFRLIPPHPASTAPPVTAAPITPLL